MRIWTTLLLTTGGCTWISQADIDARQGEVDDDGDGFLAADDCDDNDATINPGVEENWYDGVDADCAGDDDFDADADGYVPDGYFGQSTIGVEGTGLLPDGDCNDEDTTISPQAADTWYDGADTNCDGANDYDADADGYTTDEHTGAAGLPGGDCDDEDADYSPGKAETWYDGIDSDCAGDDDYDADADGYVEDAYVGETTEGQPASGRLDGGDCDDTDSTYSPGAEEVWYDGADYDCAEDNDYDADADGYTPNGYGDKAALPEGDCDDNDTAVNPSSVERLSDPRDLDCDGGGDSVFAVELAGFTGWLNPRTPRFAQNVNAIFLSLITDQATVGSLVYYDSALAITFDPNDPLGGHLDVYPWLKHIVDPSSYNLTNGHDFVVTNAYIFGVTGLQFSTHRTMRLGGYDLSSTLLDGALFNTSSSVSAFEDISLAQDSSGSLYAIGCEATTGTAQLFSTSLTSAVGNEIDNTEVITNYYADACELHLYDDPDGTLITSQPGGLVTETFDTTDPDLALTATNLNSAYTAEAIEVPEGNPDGIPLAVVADPNAIYVFEGNTIHYSLSLPDAPVSVQTTYDSDTGDMLIAFADDAGDAYLLVGDPTTGSMDEYSITTNFSATGAAAWAYDGVVTIAVTGTNELALGAAEL